MKVTTVSTCCPPQGRELGRLESGSLSGLQVEGTEDAPVVVGTWGNTVSPPEVMRIEPADGARRAITAFNAERVATIDWAPIQEFWFESRRGRRIHNMIALPPGFDPARVRHAAGLERSDPP